MKTVLMASALWAFTMTFVLILSTIIGLDSDQYARVLAGTALWIAAYQYARNPNG